MVLNISHIRLNIRPTCTLVWNPFIIMTWNWILRRVLSKLFLVLALIKRKIQNKNQLSDLISSCMFKLEISFCHKKTCNRNLKVKTISCDNFQSTWINFQLSVSFLHHLSFLDKLSLTLTLNLNLVVTVINVFPRYCPFVHSNTHYWQGFQYFSTDR